MGLYFRLAVLAAVVVAVTCDDTYNSIMSGGSDAVASPAGRAPARAPARAPVRAPSRGPLRRRLRPGSRPGAPVRRPPPGLLGRAKGRRRFPGGRPRRVLRPGKGLLGRRRQKAVVNKPTYGTAIVKPGNAKPAQFRYAQQAPKAPQQQPKATKITLKAPTAAKPISLSMPTLTNLLYKYAAKSAGNLLYNNIYSKAFGPNTYGPMPVPQGYTPAVKQRVLNYAPAPAPKPAAPVYQQVAAPVAYQPKPVAYQPKPVAYQPKPVAYQPKPVAYQPKPVAYGPQPVAYPQPAPPVSVVYSSPVVAAQKSGYPAPAPASYAPTCPAAGDFCHYKKAGHYRHPNTQACFIQCDAFGRGYAKGCSPGTLWKPVGPEPALWNMCS